MTTREELAVAAFGCSNLLFLNDEETNAIDALEAIVQEARDEAIEECAKVISLQSVSPHWPDLLRALKHAKL